MRTRLASWLTPLLLAGCAAAPVQTDWQSVAVIERNAEGQEHLALPKALPNCEYLGAVRVTIPQGVPGVPDDAVETLMKMTARKGGDTLALLPGRRVSAGTLRGSAFQCRN